MTPGGQLPADADAAIRQLYRGHAQALHIYVERFCADRASADDVVQETFIRAWRHLPKLSADDRPIRPWLFRVARNLLIDADRAARSRPVIVQALSNEDAGTDSALDQVLDRELVSAALQQLSPAHRKVLVEAFYHGGSLVAVAQGARHPARHGQITAPLRASGAAPAAARERRDRLLMRSRPSPGVPAAAAACGTTPPARGARTGLRLIAAMLLAAAALDLTRCSLVLMTFRHLTSASGLVVGRIGATVLSVTAARGCLAGHRWAAPGSATDRRRFRAASIRIRLSVPRTRSPTWRPQSSGSCWQWRSWPPSAAPGRRRIPPLSPCARQRSTVRQGRVRRSRAPARHSARGASLGDLTWFNVGVSGWPGRLAREEGARPILGRLASSSAALSDLLRVTSGSRARRRSGHAGSSGVDRRRPGRVPGP